VNICAEIGRILYIFAPETVFSTPTAQIIRKNAMIYLDT